MRRPSKPIALAPPYPLTGMLAAALLAAVVALGGCAAEVARGNPGACDGAGIIVAFTGDRDPGEPSLVRSLSEEAGFALSYARTLGTGAHLYCGADVTREAASAAAARLSRRSDVEHAEADRIMRLP